MKLTSLMILVCLVATAGCKKKPSKAPGTVEIPRDFPSDVYLYPNAAAVKAGTTKSGGHSLKLHAKDANTMKVADAYDNEMQTLGWTRTTRAKINQNLVLIFRKADRELTMETVGALGGGVVIFLEERKGVKDQPKRR